MVPDAEPPVWLLDVDGVLNALEPAMPEVPADSGGPDGVWPRAAWRRELIRSEVDGLSPLVLPIHAAQPVLDFLVRVHDAGAAEIRWHTTWGSVATTMLGPALGLPPIEPTMMPDLPAGAATWWKIPEARQVAESGRRLVWTDDQLATYRAGRRPGTGRSPGSAVELAALEQWDGALLLSPDPAEGLTARDLDRIADFLGIERPGPREPGAV